MQQLYDLQCCSHNAIPNLASIDAVLMKLVTKMAKKVFVEKGLPKQLIDVKVTQAFANKLWNGVTKGYGKSEMNIDYDSPDYNMLSALKNNVWHFSAAKNYTQLRELSNALIDQDGKLRSWSEYKKAAYAINDKHVKRYLEAEFNLAISASQAAGQWVSIVENADVMPLLYFDAIIDGRTTDLCRSLNETTLPYDHPFWDMYYVPNHFGERSRIRQLRTGKVTPADKIPSADIPEIFKTNLAKRGNIYPTDHPYWKDVPEQVKKETLKLMPYDAQFTKPEKLNKGYIREHFQIDVKSSDYPLVRSIAIELAQQGHKVDIMPVINQNEVIQRSIIFNDAKGFRNPDLRINGVLHEIENPLTNSFNNIGHSVAYASKQADHVIINLNKYVDDGMLVRVANMKFGHHKDLKKIIFRTLTGEYKEFNK